MKFTTARRALFIVGIAFAAAACGSSSSESGLASSADPAPVETTAAETTAAEDTTTTAAETTTTVEETATTAAPTGNGGFDPFEGMSAEERAAVLAQMDLTEEELVQFQQLLDTEIGREIMAEGIVEATGISSEQALCLVENGDIVGLMVGVTGGLSEPDGNVMASFLGTLDTCGIPLSAFDN